MSFCKLSTGYYYQIVSILTRKVANLLQIVIWHQKRSPLSYPEGKRGCANLVIDYGCSVKPKTRYAFSVQGLATT